MQSFLYIISCLLLKLVWRYIYCLLPIRQSLHVYVLLILRCFLINKKFDLVLAFFGLLCFLWKCWISLFFCLLFFFLSFFFFYKISLLCSSQGFRNVIVKWKSKLLFLSKYVRRNCQSPKINKHSWIKQETFFHFFHDLKRHASSWKIIVLFIWKGFAGFILGLLLLVQSRHWKHQNNLWNLSQINIKETRTTSKTSFGVFIFTFWKDFTHCFDISLNKQIPAETFLFYVLIHFLVYTNFLLRFAVD